MINYPQKVRGLDHVTHSIFNHYLVVSRKRCVIGPYSYYETLIGNHRRSIEPYVIPDDLDGV